MLTLRSKIEIGAGILILAALGIIAGSYVSAKRDAAKLQATLATQNTVIADAGKRETARDAALKESIAQIEELKKKTTTPAAVIRALPSVLPLPVPITIQAPAPGKPGAEVDLTNLPATLPAADIKPLFDFAANCQECQKKLAAAAGDKADDAIKIGALTKERDDAVTAFKGGSKWTRIKKAAKWAAIGAAMGAAAVAVAKR
jgi:hypothetical protein